MTPKSHPQPILIKKKELTTKPPPFPNKKEKTHITRPLPKEKNLRPQVHVASSHWLTKI
jgi:hypothetical protein